MSQENKPSNSYIIDINNDKDVVINILEDQVSTLLTEISNCHTKICNLEKNLTDINNINIELMKILKTKYNNNVNLDKVFVDLEYGLPMIHNYFNQP